MTDLKIKGSDRKGSRTGVRFKRSWEIQLKMELILGDLPHLSTELFLRVEGELDHPLQALVWRNTGEVSAHELLGEESADVARLAGAFARGEDEVPVAVADHHEVVLLVVPRAPQLARRPEIGISREAALRVRRSLRGGCQGIGDRDEGLPHAGDVSLHGRYLDPCEPRLTGGEKGDALFGFLEDTSFSLGDPPCVGQVALHPAALSVPGPCLEDFLRVHGHYARGRPDADAEEGAGVFEKEPLRLLVLRLLSAFGRCRSGGVAALRRGFLFLDPRPVSAGPAAPSAGVDVEPVVLFRGQGGGRLAKGVLDRPENAAARLPNE